MSSKFTPRTEPLDCKKYHHIPDHERDIYETDLVNLGYGRVKVKRLLGGNAAAAKDLLRDRVPSFEKKNRKGKYQALTLTVNAKRDRPLSNWVLFDPFACTLDKIDKHDLPLVIKLAFYEPGNAFYMEQNVTTKAIRMQSAASFPPGKRINYTINGPILVDEFEDMGDARSMDVESG